MTPTVTTSAPATAPATPVTIKATTTEASKLKSILDLIAGFAAAELPVILMIEHNPNTQVDTAAGVIAAQTAASVLDGAA